MKLKSIIIIVLCSSIAQFIISILSSTGAFQNVSSVCFGYDENYIGSCIIRIFTLPSTFSVLINAVYYISFALFLQKIKSIIPNKMLCNVALIVWVYAALIVFLYNMLNTYVGWTYNGQEIVTDTMSYWEEEGRTQYPLLYMYLFNPFLGNGWSFGGLFQSVPWMLSYILLIPVFVSIKKVNKAFGIMGIVALTLSLVFSIFIYLPAPVYWIERICWVATFAIALKECENSKL